MHSPITASSTMDERALVEFALHDDFHPLGDASAGADPGVADAGPGQPAASWALALRWEAAYAAHYAVEISDLGQSGPGSTSRPVSAGETLPSVAQTCRLCESCASASGLGLYSLWEVEGADEEGRKDPAARAVLEAGGRRQSP